MSAAEDLYDVILVGYGPVAEVLAVMLGRQGRKVAIFERWTERYPLPRAVCIDHEMVRMLSAIGMRDELPGVSHAGPPYRWLNADWQELLTIDWSAESISGGPEVHFIHQPTLEAMFDRHVRAQPTVEVHLGFDAIEASQTDDRATLLVEDRATGERRSVSARYLIGCDGANSVVRKAIGGGQEDRGFEADWLVIDILPNEGVELDVPPAAQWCNPARPTTIVPAGVRDGRHYRRWEFMRLPHETIEDIENEEAAWQLLAPWVRPDQATMVRHKVYTFRSLLAEKWRDRRLLIAGDAAHVMPPFMGQGMCAGLRDDGNLVWKLALVLDGRADDRLLDSYQAERSPHVSDVIDLSMYLGRMICQPDEAEAAERDAAFFAGTVSPPPLFPHLTDGVIQRRPYGAPTEVAGLLSPHGMMRLGGRKGRLDELAGGGFLLIATHAAMLDQLAPVARKTIAGLNIKTLALTGDPHDSRVIDDLDGKMAPFMAQHGLVAMLVRPDYYIYGGALDDASVSGLVSSLSFGLSLVRSPAETMAA
jgi:2-polyprenyl-6-methoxyphenol hydroxylase-like FAD-dependent oxidoreductase